MRLLRVADTPRQKNLDRRAFASLAVDPDMPGRLSHESVDLAQSEAGTFSNLLSRKERVEGPLLRCSVHADARIRDRDQHEFARFYAVAERRGVGLIQRGVGSLDDELTAVRHGIARIEAEI